MKYVIILLVGIIIGVGGLYFYRNMLVETAVEKGSSYALGVETDLGSAGLEISGGSLELNDFEVSNPDGYETDNFLVIKNGILDVNEGSLLDDEVVIDSFVIDGIEINFEQMGTKTNIQEIVNHIKNLDVTSSDNGTQKFKINKISIKNISVNTLYNLLDKKVENKFEVDDFTLNNIGDKSGLTIGELTALVIKKVSVKTIAGYRKSQTADALKELGGQAGEVLKEITDDAAEKLEELGKSVFGK